MTHFLLPEILNEDKDNPFTNCIRKNYRHIKKWAKRTQTNCFRIYDREINHYPLAIDFYNGKFCIQLFSSKKNELSEDFFKEIDQVLCSLFGMGTDSIYWRSHIKRKRIEQYEKLDTSKEFFNVLEYGLLFKVNLQDYLDTGLFLDHRETRKYISSISSGKNVLNLFAYTCSFSVYAAFGGALLTKSVDMSNTYTTWGKDNFLLNGFSLDANIIVKADCMPFLEKEIQCKQKYDIIIIDPPTISRSKKMKAIFDIQIDYIPLIQKALKLLSKDGLILFSTNSRKFIFDKNQFPNCTILDVTSKTIPMDFHNKKIHSCWKISNFSL